MSVVNQMLKDLEQRKAEDAGYSAVYEPSKNNKNAIVIKVLIVALLLLVGILGWIAYHYQFEQQEKGNPVEPPVSSANLTTASTNLASTANGQMIESEGEPERKSRPMVSVTEPPSQSQPQAIPANNAIAESDPGFEAQVAVDVSSSTHTVTDNKVTAAANNAIAESDPGFEAQIAAEKPSGTSTNSASDNNTAAVFKQQAQPNELVKNPSTMRVEKSSSEASVLATNDFSKQASGSQSTGTSLREQALAALRAGQDALGVQLLTQLTQLEPTNTAAYKKLAAVLYSQNQSIRATAVLEDGIRIAPQDADLRLMMARLLSRNNENTRALTVITPEVPLIGISTEFLSYRAALAEQLGIHSVAFADYLQLSAEQPNESRWWLGLAISSERTEAPQMALEAYQRVIAQNQLGTEVQSFAQQRINQLARTQ